MNAFYAQPKGGVTVNQMQSGAMGIEHWQWLCLYWRWYRGTTLVFPTDKGLTAVNYVDLEQYLYSVLGSEMNGNWPQEALKPSLLPTPSTSGKTRRMAFMIWVTHRRRRFTKALKSESSGTHKAVNATDGQVLIYKRIGSFSRFSCLFWRTPKTSKLVSIPALPAWRSRF